MEFNRMNIEKKAIQSYSNSLINIYPDLSQEELCFITNKVTVTKLDNRKYCYYSAIRNAI